MYSISQKIYVIQMPVTDALFPPTTNSALRACTRCRLIQPADTWRQRSCPNCEPGREKGYAGAELSRRVTRQFDGSVGVLSTENSYVCRSLGLQGNLTPGMYAMKLIHVDTADSEEE